MVQFRTIVCVIVLGVVFGGAPATAWPEKEGVPAKSPAEVAKASFLAYYTGEYGALYELTSLRDCQVKTKTEYLSERPPFEAAERAVAKLLVAAIRFERSEVKIRGDRARVTLISKIPDDSKPPLAEILEGPGEQIGELKRVLESGELPLREERITLVLVREGETWRVFFGWASAVKVRFSGEVKMNLPWEFGPKQGTPTAINKINELRAMPCPLFFWGKHQVSTGLRFQCSDTQRPWWTGWTLPGSRRARCFAAWKRGAV